MSEAMRAWLKQIGREGGKKGGKNAAANMTDEARVERAKAAAQARWKKVKKK